MAYANDVTVIVSRSKHRQQIDVVIKDYDAVTGVKLNHEQSVGLQLGKSMPSNNVVHRWTDGSVKLFGVRYGVYLHVEKIWDEVTNLIQEWVERKLFLR